MTRTWHYSGEQRMLCVSCNICLDASELVRAGNQLQYEIFHVVWQSVPDLFLDDFLDRTAGNKSRDAAKSEGASPVRNTLHA